MGRWLGMIIGAASLAASLPTTAQTLVAPPPVVAPVESLDAAIAQDAAAVADRLGLPVADAVRHLRLQVASAPVTDAIADEFAARLTGIALVHRPDFAIVVTLTGAATEPERIVDLDGAPVRISFHTGATATHTGLVQAIGAYQAAIRASLLSPPGLGIDQRSGELVAVVSTRDVAREGAEPLAARLAALTRVPVRLRVVDQPALDMGGIQGGTRVVGQVPGDSHRYLCTAGFVVTDGSRTGIATAAHCPDALSARDAAGVEQALPFVGQWGWGHQDVQINASAVPLAPLFYADSARTVSRPVSDARGRAGTRAGDVVCHRGERTGYSCSEVELTDFAPAGDLCGGACLPTWTTVAGPVCKSGDSGSPVFLGDTAYGILKGGSYRADGSCAFYFYMSTDFLPSGWQLLMMPGIVPSP